MEICQNVRLVYYSFKAPWPVTNRDFFACAGEKITVIALFTASFLVSTNQLKGSFTALGRRNRYFGSIVHYKR
jgi:hypothetical protein